MKAVLLSAEQLSTVLKCVASGSNQKGAIRIAAYLGQRHSVRTSLVNVECSVGNLSDQVSRHINPHIEHLGLYVACAKPARQFRNKFGEKTQETRWSFYAAAANDPDFDISELGQELDALAPDLPDLDADSWEKTLADVGIE